MHALCQLSNLARVCVVCRVYFFEAMSSSSSSSVSFQLSADLPPEPVFQAGIRRAPDRGLTLTPLEQEVAGLFRSAGTVANLDFPSDCVEECIALRADNAT
jgi:hypothetical protein